MSAGMPIGKVQSRSPLDLCTFRICSAKALLNDGLTLLGNRSPQTEQHFFPFTVVRYAGILARRMLGIYALSDAPQFTLPGNATAGTHRRKASGKEYAALGLTSAQVADLSMGRYASNSSVHFLGTRTQINYSDSHSTNGRIRLKRGGVVDH